MRQDYRAGEKMFVDYAGQSIPIIDRRSGEVHEAKLFVSVLGVRIPAEADQLFRFKSTTHSG